MPHYVDGETWCPRPEVLGYMFSLFPFLFCGPLLNFSTLLSLEMTARLSEAGDPSLLYVRLRGTCKLEESV